MLAVDTNIVVRLLTEDDPQQAAAAKRIFSSGPVWIPKTVFLETAWVLESVYSFKESAIQDAFSSLLGYENVYTEDATSMRDALALCGHGIELADAIHLTSRPPGTRFASFDRKLIRSANAAGVSNVVNGLFEPE